MAKMSLVLLFVTFHFALKFGAVLLTRVAFGVPCIVLDMVPGLGRAGHEACRTTLSLKTSPICTFFGMMLPSVVPKVFSNFLLSFAVSLSSFIVARFAGNPNVSALSAGVCDRIHGKVGPRVCTLSAVVFIAILLLLVLVGVSPIRGGGTMGMGRFKGTRGFKEFFFRHLMPITVTILVVVNNFVCKGGSIVSSRNRMVICG